MAMASRYASVLAPCESGRWSRLHSSMISNASRSIPDIMIDWMISFRRRTKRVFVSRFPPNFSTIFCKKCVGLIDSIGGFAANYVLLAPPIFFEMKLQWTAPCLWQGIIYTSRFLYGVSYKTSHGISYRYVMPWDIPWETRHRISHGTSYRLSHGRSHSLSLIHI